MKTEKWNDHDIRFVEHEGAWWAILKDVCDALGLKNPTMAAKRIDAENALKADPKLNLGSHSNEPITIVNEFGIYQTIFQSRKREAKDFQKWTYTMLKTLREQSGLEGFEVFRMLDKEHQKQAMRKLCEGLREPIRLDFMKANCITNKAVSNKHGFPTMLKKSEMTPAMLRDRERVLEDVVELTTIKDKYGLNISVAEQIYKLC